jgi:hypothetical protein
MFLLLQIAITDVFITSTDRISIKVGQSFILINSGKSSPLQFVMQVKLGFLIASDQYDQYHEILSYQGTVVVQVVIADIP